MIIVEVKAIKHSDAEKEVQYYMENNKINKDLIGIAVSGQDESQIKVTYFYKLQGSAEILTFKVRDTLLPLDVLERKFQRQKYGEIISDEELVRILKDLNNIFHEGNKIRDTDRSLFLFWINDSIN